MGNFGINEWLIIGVVTLILIRPKEYPKIAYKIGQWYQKWTRAYYAVTDELTAIHDGIKQTELVIKSPKNTLSQSKTTKNTKI
jgi:Sec-independent protein translocase protein TatA